MRICSIGSMRNDSSSSVGCGGIVVVVVLLSQKRVLVNIFTKNVDNIHNNNGCKESSRQELKNVIVVVEQKMGELEMVFKKNKCRPKQASLFLYMSQNWILFLF